jgi:hypothetical protein
MAGAPAALPSNPHPRRTDNWLLDLPTEVRHAIYHRLFCETKYPIWIAQHYKLWATLLPSKPNHIFQTQTFRLCKSIHEDAVKYAYGFNCFELRDDFAAFCRLGRCALASIRDLTVIQGAWRAETDIENEAWSIIQQSCDGLANLEVVLHADMLIPAIPCLEELVKTAASEASIPKVAVDLHVWDRHFSFDSDTRDYARAQQLLNGTYVGGPNRPKFIPPRDRILRLPTEAHQIVLTADVASGTIRALDEYLASLDRPLLEKSLMDTPVKGHRAVGGRSNRYWYNLTAL